MTPLDHLRTAVALAHAVPGASLALTTHDRGRIVVGHQPSASIDPCAMRRVVMASACPGEVDLSRRIATIELGGALDDIGGGIVRVRRGEREERWLTSLLVPHRLAALVSALGDELGHDDDLHACVKPDAELGVSLLVLSAPTRRDGLLDDVAARAAGRCYVDELLCAAAHLRSGAT